MTLLYEIVKALVNTQTTSKLRFGRARKLSKFVDHK